jgi:cytochrome c biogenesis protein CcdA
MAYGFLADALVVIHTAYVSFVVIGMFLILAGAICRWKWVRNPWFRWAHLVAIVIVGVEAVLGITCPLTDWESHLRKLAGQKPSEGSFIGRSLDDILFFSAPEWLLAACHIGFALLVLVTFCLFPPRSFRLKDNVKHRDP